MSADFDHVYTHGLAKMYGLTRALRGVDLAFASGLVTVVEGPNGSGKSTLLAMLAMLGKPTRGKVLYGEVDSQNGGASLRARIGLLAHAAMVYPDLDARQGLLFFARLHAVADPVQRVSALLERFELGAWAGRPARTYSRGQLQRLALARALIHSPRLLLLDEPSAGLDSRALDLLAHVIDEERRMGRILVLVTHDPALIERVADRRVRLDRGRVAESA